MSPFGCAREKEIAALVNSGHWPQACAEELRAHVADCRVCGDLLLVMQTLQTARTAAMPEARLDAAGALWWRAQLRRRNAVVAQIARPMLGAQIFALTLAVIAAIGTAVLGLRSMDHVTDQAANWLRPLNVSTLLPAILPDGRAWWLAAIVATLVLVSGVVAYLASEKQ